MTNHIVGDPAPAKKNRAWPRLSKPNARTIAFKALYRVLEEDGYTNLSLRYFLNGVRLDARERSFATAIVYGTVTRLVTIDYLLSKISNTPLEKLQPAVRTVLRMGMWQIRWSFAVPAAAVVDESCKLTRLVANPGAVGLVNGVLRKASTKTLSLPQRDFALRHALIPELGGLLKSWFGEKRAEDIMEAFAKPPPLTIRVRDSFIDDDSQIELSAGAFFPQARTVKELSAPLERLQAFIDGSFYVQGEGAMLAGHLVDAKTGQHALDVCAAPGGKTAQLAEQVGPTGQVVARDIHPARAELIEQNMKRLKLDNVLIQISDAAVAHPQDRRKFDRVLVDAPCSGLGQLANRPELRFRMTYEQIRSLPPLQMSILKAAAKAVRLGGRLIYSTCTINPTENEGVVQSFLAEHADSFRAYDLSDLLPLRLARADSAIVEHAKNGYLTLLPDKVDCEGFFIAALERITD